MNIDVEICAKCGLERVRRSSDRTTACPLCGNATWEYDVQEAKGP